MSNSSRKHTDFMVILRYEAHGLYGYITIRSTRTSWLYYDTKHTDFMVILRYEAHGLHGYITIRSTRTSWLYYDTKHTDFMVILRYEAHGLHGYITIRSTRTSWLYYDAPILACWRRLAVWYKFQKQVSALEKFATDGLDILQYNHMKSECLRLHLAAHNQCQKINIRQLMG